MANFVPSPYQQTVLDFIATGTGSAIIVAGPGSGKTKTIERCLPLIPEHKHVQCFAFNSTIGKELQARVELLKQEFGRPFANVRAGTFHSVGYGAVCRHLGLKPFQVKTDSKKLQRICREWLGENERGTYGDFICKLVSLAKGQGVGPLLADTDGAWLEIINHHDMYLEAEGASEERAVELARQLLRISNERAKQADIDFDDQLYLPLLWRLRLWQNDFVFVDEAQDTNPVRRAIAKLALRPGGRLIAVGDPRQAIYGFTGATADAMDLIKHELACRELPLTVCYRCDAAVVRAVERVYPGCIEAAPGAAEGSAILDENGEPQVDAFEEVLPHLQATDAILCRNVAPIVALAYELIARGRGCRILGRDIGEGLIKLVDAMRARTISALEEKLEAYRQREVAKHTARGEEAKAEGVNDRVDCLATVIGNLHENERTVQRIKDKIAGMFSDGASELLTLCSIHKAKGKEWPRVCVYRPELMPSKWARQEHQLAQEKNLDWVARSRAQHELYWAAEATGRRPTAKQRRQDAAGGYEYGEDAVREQMDRDGAKLLGRG